MSDPATRPPRRNITPRRIIKWLAYGAIALFFTLLLTVLSGTLIFIYWLKYGDLAHATGNAIYALTGVETAIDSLEIQRGGTVSAKGIKIKTPDGLRIWVDSAGAKIKLGSLLKGKVTLADLSVTRPTVSLALAGPVPSAAPKPLSLEMPSFTTPAPVEVESLKVTDFLLEAHGKNEYMMIGGVNLTAKGRVGPYGANITSTLVTSEDSTIVWESGGKTIEISPRVISTVSLQESGDFTALLDSEFFMMNAPENLGAGLPPRVKMALRASGEVMGLPSGKSSLSVWLDGEETVDASAALIEKSGTLAYEVSAKKFHIPLNRLADGFAPENIKMNGFAEMAPFSVKGLVPLDGKEMSADVSGEARLRLYYLSGFGISLPQGGRANLKLDGFRVSAAGYSGGFDGEASVPRLEKEGGFSASGVFAKLSGKAASGADTSKGEITVSLFAAGVKDEKLTLDGVKVWTRAGGDFLKGDFPNFHLNLTAQENISVKASGSFKKFGQAGLKIKTEFKTPFDTVTAIGPLRQSQVVVTGGEIMGSIAVDGLVGDGFNAPLLDIRADTEFTGVSGSVRSAGVELTSASGSLSAKVGVNPQWEATNFSARLDAKLSKADVEKMVAMESVNLALAVSSPIIPAGALNADLNSTVEHAYPLTQRGGDSSPEKPLAVDVAFTFDPSGQIVNLQKGVFKIGSSTLNGHGSYDINQAGFKGGISAESLDLKTVYAFLPPKTREQIKLRKLAGILDFNIAGEGKLPKSWSDEALSPPFDLAVSLKLKNGDIQSREPGMDVEKADINLKGDISKTALRLAGSADVKRLKAKDYFGGMEVDASVLFDVESWKDKRIEARQLEISSRRLGVSESLKGTVKGISLQNLAQVMEKPASLLPNLSMNLENSFSMALDKGAATALDMNLQGRMKANLSVASTAKRDISISGAAEFMNLTAHSGGKPIVERLNGRIPFAKTYAFDGAPETTARIQSEEAPPTSSHGARDTSFFENLRGAGARRDSVTASRVEAGFLTLRDVIMDITFKETRLSMDYVKMNLLDGGLTGSVYMRGEKDRYSMRLSNVFAGLNMGKLFEDGAGLTGHEAEVDGAMDVSLGLKKGAENEDIDLARLEISLTLSRIGGKALEKVLLFIDPKESSPAVMNARSLLKYATPEKVEIATRHGALSVTVDMKYTPALGGQTVSMPIMKRAPMTRLVNFGVIKEWSKKLSPLVVVLRHVGATTISVDEKGELKFR